MSIKKAYTTKDLFKDYGALTLGEVLRSYRLCDELTQAEFAKRLGISAANLCDLEKGRKVPSLNRVVKIARKLGISDTFLVQVALQDMLKREKLTFTISVAA
jgi:transcriptional regulator with XRE-family HTH domain